MKVLQGNMHRSKTAHALLDQLKQELGFQVAIISEQYKGRGDQNWLSDETNTAAIWIADAAIGSVTRKGTGNGYVWARINKVTIVSCYLTPSENIQEFTEKLRNIEDTVSELERPLILAGDLNASAIEWGMKRTNTRGELILELASRQGLGVANIGKTPTFQRPNEKGTIPDVTLVSESMLGNVNNWRVDGSENGSDHKYIVFDTQKDPRPRQKVKGKGTWNVTKLKETKLIASIREGNTSPSPNEKSTQEMVESTMARIRKACDDSMPKRFNGKRRSKWSTYWWNEEIAELRRECLRLRRRTTRTRKRTPDIADRDLQQFREARRNLKNAIFRSKRQKWEELCEDINRDPWGLGYKVVMQKLKARPPNEPKSLKDMERIVDALFPTHTEGDRPKVKCKMEDIPLFTTEEVQAAARSLQNGKAPGPDGIPAEALKVIARHHPEPLVKMYNSCLKDGIFPKAWKRQRLVLISKGKGDPNSPSGNRPLCMLDTTGKLLEKLIKPRLNDAIDRAGGLSPRQHGFRQGFSTVGAVQQVVEVVYRERNRNHFSRGIVTLMTLDVRNAFNSARWDKILASLTDTFHVPPYLLRMVQSYLSERELTFDTAEGPRTREITAGAAQGSILGPDLWNAAYDGILQMEMPEDTFLVGYADDIAAVIVTRTVEAAQMKVNQVMRRVLGWLLDHGLTLATEKTEILLITGKRIPKQILMRAGPETLTTQDTVRYLGIQIDGRLNFGAHVKQAAAKASQVTTNLIRVMANIGGPRPNKRKLLLSVTNSILLYGCEIWADALRKKCHRTKMARVQRVGALRTISAYRTVSEPAALLIAGTVPIDLVAHKRKRVFQRRGEDRKVVEPQENTRMIHEWMERLNRDGRGSWTRKIIHDPEKWLERKHGEVNYYLTQFLSGHGYFRSFLKNIGKAENSKCTYCESNKENAHHTFFMCSRWDRERAKLTSEVLAEWTPDSALSIMIKNKGNWNAVDSFVKKVLITKKREETNGMNP